MRHGAPLRTGLMLGHTDEPPTPAGSAACVSRGEGLCVDHIICSDLARARQPAEVLAEKRGLPLDVDPNWRELDFGAWDGADPKDIDSKSLFDFWNDPDSFPPPGGESWTTLSIRVAGALGVIDSPTLIITHAGAIRAALGHLLGFNYRQLWAFSLPYGALVSLRIWPDPERRAEITGLSE
jgi:alpha-ribazole phosphatase